MATAMTADQFLNQLARWSVPVKIVYSDWRTHNHNLTQPRGSVSFLVIHHTGDDAPDSADERVLHDGRSDLPGPLCNWGMDDAGNVVPIGWGTAYHAGAGASNVLAAVRSENYGSYPPNPGPDDTNGNPISYGQETMYSGTHRMTDAAYRSTVLVSAAVCEFHGWSAKSVIGHKEWTNRKPDPGYLDMAIFRADVQRAIDAGPPRSTTDTTTPEDDMGTFIAETSDGRAFLVTGGVKYYLPSPQYHELIDVAKIPDRGTMSGATLSLFPTADGVAGLESAFRTTVTSALASLASTLASLATAVADDATSAQVEDLKTEIDHLQELITALGTP